MKVDDNTVRKYLLIQGVIKYSHTSNQHREPLWIGYRAPDQIQNLEDRLHLAYAREKNHTNIR